jgi:hypothetical protein
MDKINLNDPRYTVLGNPNEIDIDKFISEKNKSQPSQPPPQVSLTESALRGGAQGVSFGFPDEATARLESITKGVSYEQALKESRDAYKRAQEANPITYTLSEIAGGVLPAFVPGGVIAKAGQLVSKIPLAGRAIQSLSAMSPLAKGVALGGTTGAVTGLGMSEGQDIGEVVRDVGIGTALGGALPVIGSKLFPKKLQSEISKKAGETVSKEASQTTGKEITKETIGQAAKKEGIPLGELEKSLQNAKTAYQDNLGAKLSQADELISVLTGKKESLINFLRQNPEKSKQIAEITNTVQKSDDLARILTEYATANPTKRQGIYAAIKGKEILKNSGINISNEKLFNILDQSRNRIIETNKLGISDAKNLAEKQIGDISTKIINQESYDGKALRDLLGNLDDQVKKYGGYYSTNDKNELLQTELKKVRGEINDYIKTQLPEDVRKEYSKQYELASTKLNQAENIKSMLTSKRASMRAKGSNIGDLEKANTILNRYISRPTAGKEDEITYLTKLLQEKNPLLNLKDELDKIRIAKQIESAGEKGSNIVQTFKGMAKVDLPIEFPGSKLFTRPIEQLLETEASYIGKRLGEKGGKLAQEWADYSGELLKKGITPTQTDAFKFILAQSSKEMQPGFRQTLARKFGANLPEEAIPMNLPSPASSPIPPMGSPMPTSPPIPGQKTTRESIMNKFTIPQSEQRGFAAQQGIQRGLLDQFLSDNRPEVERREKVKNNYQDKVINRVK